MVIHPCAKFGTPMPKKILLKYKFKMKIVLKLRPKVKVLQSSWMCLTHCPMVIHSWFKYGMIMSKNKNAVAQTQIHIKANVVSGSWMYAASSHVPSLLCQCQIKQNKTGRTRCNVKNPLTLTLRSKVNVVQGSWRYKTHSLVVIDPCVKYCNVKPRKSYGPDTKTCKNPIKKTWGQRSMSYWDHECTRHILSW